MQTRGTRREMRPTPMPRVRVFERALCEADYFNSTDQ